MSSALGGLTILGTQLQPGLEAAETGINATSIKVKYMPEFITKLKNYQNQTTGRVVPTVASRQITIVYEFVIGSSTGLTTATFLVDSASLITNDKAEFGSPVGIVMLDDVEADQTREGIRTVTMNLTSDPLFTAV